MVTFQPTYGLVCWQDHGPTLRYLHLKHDDDLPEYLGYEHVAKMILNARAHGDLISGKIGLMSVTNLIAYVHRVVIHCYDGAFLYKDTPPNSYNDVVLPYAGWSPSSIQHSKKKCKRL